MKVTGEILRAKIKDVKTDIEIFSDQFSDNLTYFESDPETKVDVNGAMLRLEKAQIRLASLKAAQTQYNSKVKTKFSHDGQHVTLHEAFSLLGVYGKIEGMWRTAAKTKVGTGRLYGTESRSRDEEYAKKAVSTELAVNKAREAGTKVGQLSAAINAANLVELDLDLPASLLD